MIGYFEREETLEYQLFSEISGKFQNGIPFWGMVSPHFEHFQIFLKKTLNVTLDEPGNGIFIFSRELYQIAQIPFQNYQTDHVINWIHENTKPLIVEMTPYSFPEYLKVSKPTLIWFFNESTPVFNDYILNNTKKLASLERHNFTFTYIDAIRFSHIFSQIFQNQTPPQIVLMINKEYFVTEENVDPLNQTQHLIDAFNQKTLKKVYKNTPSSTELSFNTFQIFFKSLKNRNGLVVLFYSNGCVHCHFFSVFFDEVSFLIKT